MLIPKSHILNTRSEYLWLPYAFNDVLETYVISVRCNNF